MTGIPGGEGQGRNGSPQHPDKGVSVGEYAGLGIQFAASIVVFLYLGQWLDRKLGTAPWLLLAGVFVGAGGSFYSMYRRLMVAQAREDAARAARRKEGQR
jgi:F0F1-type ATP synthase assembly protein I